MGEELNEEDMGVKMAAKAILGGIEKRRNNYIEKKNLEMEEQARRRRPEVFSMIYDYIDSDDYNSWRAIYGDKEDRKSLYQEIKVKFPIVSYDNEDNNKLINGAIKTVRENWFNNHQH